MNEEKKNLAILQIQTLVLLGRITAEREKKTFRSHGVETIFRLVLCV